jgi:hypothetical protein
MKIEVILTYKDGDEDAEEIISLYRKLRDDGRFLELASGDGKDGIHGLDYWLWFKFIKKENL